MSLWINVYCKKRLRLTAERLERAVRKIWPNLDDCYSEFHITQVSQPRASRLLHLTYQVAENGPMASTTAPRIGEPPPIVLHRADSAEEAADLGREYIDEYLTSRRSPLAKHLREYLSDISDVYSFSLKAAHMERDQGRALAITAAHCLAELSDGLVRDERDDWLFAHPRWGLCELKYHLARRGRRA